MTGKVNMVCRREGGPITRGQLRQSRPNTRAMRRLDTYRRLRLLCALCAGSENPGDRVKTSTSGVPTRTPHSVEKCHFKTCITDDPKKHLEFAHKINRVCKAREARSRLRHGRVSVKSEVSVRKPEEPSPAAACAATSKFTSFGEYNHPPFAFANSTRYVKGVGVFGSSTRDWTYSGLSPKKQNTADRFQQEGKIIFWEDFYPRVKLCDISRICVECKHKCSFALPNNVKSRHCCKEEMRAGFRFESGCVSQKKQSSNEVVQVRNNGQLSRSDLGTNPGQLTNVSVGQKDMMDTDSGAPANHSLWNQESDGLACSEQRPLKLCLNGLQSKCTDSGQSISGNEPLINIKHSTLSKDSTIQNDDCMNSSQDKGFCGIVGSVHFVDSPKRTEGWPLKPNGFDTLDKTDELDSFTCQRVRVYPGKRSTSCARTYLTWPQLSKKNISIEVPENGRAGNFSPCQISQTFALSNPDQLPHSNLTISNQGMKAKLHVNASSCVVATSNLSRSENKRCPLDSPQKSGPKAKIIETLYNSLSRSTLQNVTPVQVKESSLMTNDSSSFTPSPPTLDLTETSPSIFAATFPETSRGINSVSSSPVTLLAPNTCGSNPPQAANLASFDSHDSCDSSSLLPQDMEVSKDKIVTPSPPKLKPYFKAYPFIEKNPTLCTEICSDADILLPPLLSPLNSPLKHIMSSSSVEYGNNNDNMVRSKMLSESHIPELTDVSKNSHTQEDGCPQMEAFSSHKVHKFVIPPDSPVSDSSTKSSFSSSSNKKSDDDTSSDQLSYCSEMSENQETKDLEQQEVLDEVEAYEHDILLVDVFQDDPDLFKKLPQKSLLKLGPVRTNDTPQLGCKKMVNIMLPVSQSSKITQSIAPVNLDLIPDSPEHSPRRSWRPQCNRTTSPLLCGAEKQNKTMCSYEAKPLNTRQDRTIHFPTENISHNISPLLAARIGFITRTTSTLNAADVRWQKPAYCRNYFSESQSCGFKACRFQHVPMDGDEKFCTETLARFAKNPACLHKAGAVFTGFYKSNKPGMYFSLPVLLTLLWALLKAGMITDLFSVLRTALAHNLVPDHDFLLELFNFIREKSLVCFIPELILLTFKMKGAGLSLNLDCLDWKNTELHQLVSSSSGLSGNRSTPTEYLNLVHALVEMELCTKQEDWKRLGNVFQSICQFTQQINQVERIIGQIAVALLSESKDRLNLPFAVFAETATHNMDDDGPVRSFLGRIGVSLMLRYYKTYQWAKGQKVVEVLCAAKVSYATLKGLFGNEDGTSRCHLINVATEIFLSNNSVEGALNTLRENEWFLTSSGWPCEAADIENRIHVLLRLAEMTSHRDTLEVLSNLPGLKEPNGHIDISRYTTYFTARLQVCLERQIMPVASDLVDFMLSKGLQVDHAMLQMLLHKLGKQNLWLRARELFKHSVKKGYYPGVSAPLGQMTLVVSPQLGEIELALTFEMFITLNASGILALPECSTSTMSITLTRTQSGESDYLSAGSRLLSAACIPQPKLSVHYMAVNSSQEQVFALDVSSARRWLRSNHLWANEVWTFST